MPQRGAVTQPDMDLQVLHDRVAGRPAAGGRGSRPARSARPRAARSPAAGPRRRCAAGGAAAATRCRPGRVRHPARRRCAGAGPDGTARGGPRRRARRRRRRRRRRRMASAGRRTVRPRCSGVARIEPAGIDPALRAVADRVQRPAGTGERVGFAARRVAPAVVAQPHVGGRRRQVAKGLGVAGNPAPRGQPVAGGEDVGAGAVHGQPAQGRSQVD